MKTKKHRLGIKAVALAAAAALTLTACGGGGDDAKSDGSVKIAVFPSFNSLSAYAADIKGTFKDHDLEVEFVTVATPAEGMPQLIGDKIDFALMDVTTPIVARSQGVP